MKNKVIRLTEKELIKNLERIIKEQITQKGIDPQERAYLVDDVINRINEFGSEYVDRLIELNSQYEPVKHTRMELGKERKTGLKIGKTVYPN
jgi:hypothetical protein